MEKFEYQPSVSDNLDKKNALKKKYDELLRLIEEQGIQYDDRITIDTTAELREKYGRGYYLDEHTLHFRHLYEDTLTVSGTVLDMPEELSGGMDAISTVEIGLDEINDIKKVL